MTVSSLLWVSLGNSDLSSVTQSWRILSASPCGYSHIAPALRQRLSILSAALCEENTRCRMWSLGLAAQRHGNADQTAAPTRGDGRGRQRAERGRLHGVSRGNLSIYSKTVTHFILGKQTACRSLKVIEQVAASRDGKQHLSIFWMQVGESHERDRMTTTLKYKTGSNLLQDFL